MAQPVMFMMMMMMMMMVMMVNCKDNKLVQESLEKTEIPQTNDVTLCCR
jgi:hypothetical protein